MLVNRGGLVVLVSFLVSCASDAGPPRVETEVRYAGTTSGTLVLAAFEMKPPMGPPLAVAQKAGATFPATLTLELPAGSAVFVLAMLDVAPASPQQPGPEDRTVWSDALTISDGVTPLTLELVDP